MSYNHLSTFERTRIKVLSKIGYSTRQKGKHLKSQETQGRFNIRTSIHQRPKTSKNAKSLNTGN